MLNNSKKDDRENQPLAQRSLFILDHESGKQGTNPQDDIFEDQMADRGQEIEDHLLAEERDPVSLVEAFNRTAKI